MFKRRTSRVRQRKQVRVLRANVMSPRIFWFDVRRMLGSLCRMVAMIAVIAAAGWGVWIGVRKGLIENEEFALRDLALNDNVAVDEARLVEVTGLDPTGSLFQCDVGKMRERLLALPEVETVKVRREFPGTLHVAVHPRRPVLWVAVPEQGIPARDPQDGLLVDADGLAFPCPPRLYEQASRLPVIELRPEGATIAAGKRVEHPDFLRGLRLYEAAKSALPDAPQWIDTIRQYKEWASQMVTRDGLEATFGHEEIETQMGDLVAAVEHARDQGQRIATIQLIGKRNLPVTLHEAEPPRAIPVEELPPVEAVLEDEPSGEPASTPEPQAAPEPPSIHPDLNDLLER